MKNLLLVISTLMMASSAMASRHAELHVNLNDQQGTLLTSCQGTVTAKGGFAGKGKSNQIHIHVENSQYCDKLDIPALNKSYTLGTAGYGRGGDYTISTGALNMGWNKVDFNLYSTTTKAKNNGSVWVNVVSPVACYSEAQLNAYERDLDFTQVRFDHPSKKGNLVFTIGNQGQVVMNRSCQVVGE